MVPLVLTDEWRSAWRLNCQASLGPVTPGRLLTWPKVVNIAQTADPA